MRNSYSPHPCADAMKRVREKFTDPEDAVMEVHTDFIKWLDRYAPWFGLFVCGFLWGMIFVGGSW